MAPALALPEPLGGVMILRLIVAAAIVQLVLVPALQDTRARFATVAAAVQQLTRQ
jgi:hypothetical protein